MNEAMKVYIDNAKNRHMIWRSYHTHPPIIYVPRNEARLCHFIGSVPKHNRKPFIKDIEHVLFTRGLSRDYVARLKQAPRVEREFHGENCKAVFVFCDSCLRQVADHIDTTGIEDKLHIVLPAYPNQADKIYGHSGPFRLLTISNKFWGRGIHLAIEVFRNLRGKYGNDVRMTLVCDSVPADYPLVDGLELIGAHRLKNSLLHKLYSEADVFLLLGLIDSGTVLEAMAYGVPTVGTPNFDRGGWILPGQTGFVVEAPFHIYDASFGIEWKTFKEFQGIVKARFERGELSYMVTEATAHVETLINNPDQLKTMGQQAQKHQRRKHSFKYHNAQVRQIYADILSGML